ncbi:MAG: transcriptional regulator with domain and aminotransferase domain [Clostridia bacterium]|nr:transcriptional regulator with domain and aminotransferase domain [Clostridia bacterium]
MNIRLAKGSSQPLYIQLFEQLKELIEQGILPEDYKLPTIRELGRELNVNNITVVNAYKLLEDHKLIYKKVGSGSYVLPIEENLIINNAVSNEDDRQEYDYNTEEGYIDFATASPDPRLFPMTDFKKAINDVIERDGGNAFMYHDSRGYLPLRSSIADYLSKKEIEVGPEDVYIISGAQQGIDIIAKALLTNGDYVFVESPTYTGAAAVFKSRGARIVEIPLQSDGPDMNELEKLLQVIKPKFMYTMPNFQNPTGCSYSERKKKHLLLLCKKYKLLIVEDDYSGDLSYKEKPATPLKSYDNADSVIYIKSFSKIFMPGLRVAFLIIPEPIKKMIESAKYMTDISTSGFMQRVLDLYLNRNILDEHIRYMKKEYGLRYFEAVRAAKKYLRGALFSQPYGGLNLWIRLPEGIDSSKLYERCKKNMVLITPGTVFLKGEEGEQHMRISFSGVDVLDITKGIAIVGNTIEEMKKESRIGGA